MKLATLYALLLASEFADAYVKLPFQQHKRLVKRDGNFAVTLGNEQSFYSVDFKIGTPAQDITLLIDTGSSDTWIMGSDNSLCSNNKKQNSLDNNFVKIFPDKVKKEGVTLTKKDTVIEVTCSAGADGKINSNCLNNVGQMGGLGSALLSMLGPIETSNGGSGSSSGGNPFSIPDNLGSFGSGQSMDCSTYGTFSKSASSTWHNNNTDFAITYGDDSYASGTWGTDVVQLGDVNITGVSVAVANFTNSTIGVMGIGLTGLETTYTGQSSPYSKSYQYSNFPVALKQDGIIDRVSYSLFLDDAEAKKGSILFGGVDHSKYSGTLYTVPLVNVYRDEGVSQPIEFDVTLYGMGLSQGNDNLTIATTKMPALLDSGTTLAYFPEDLLQLVAGSMGADYDSSLGYYTMNCIDDASSKFVFDFGGFHITSPISNFLSQVSANQCALTIGTSSYGKIILGDVFLQNAYVVYDLENLEISMAQANFNGKSSDSTIEDITNNVPNAVKAASYSNVYTNGIASITSGGDIFTVKDSAGGVSTSNTTKSGSSATKTTNFSNTKSQSTTTKGENKQNIANLVMPTSKNFFLGFILSLFL